MKIISQAKCKFNFQHRSRETGSELQRGFVRQSQPNISYVDFLDFTNKYIYKYVAEYIKRRAAGEKQQTQKGKKKQASANIQCPILLINLHRFSPPPPQMNVALVVVVGTSNDTELGAMRQEHTYLTFFKTLVKKITSIFVKKIAFSSCRERFC